MVAGFGGGIEDICDGNLMPENNNIEKMLTYGKISYSNWADYTWKNELLEQQQNVLLYLEEIIKDVSTEYNPYHLFERSFSLCSFSMRRLIECRLLTDNLINSNLDVWKIPAANSKSFREKFRDTTGGNIFENYNMSGRQKIQTRPNDIVSKFLHASTLAVISGSKHLPDGILVASDWQEKNSLFHFTSEEFESLVSRFLDDRIKFSSEQLDPVSGKVTSKRE